MTAHIADINGVGGITKQVKEQRKYAGAVSLTEPHSGLKVIGAPGV